MDVTLFPEELLAQAAAVVALCRERAIKLVTAESCTGGLVAAVLTEVAGSSAVVERGLVTYSNEAKAELLGVPLAVLQAHGAVSRQTAEAMARGALTLSHAQGAVSITGIAGPGGGSADKPIGLVHFAFAIASSVDLAERRFGPIGRLPIRLASVAQALAMIERGVGGDRVRSPV